MDKSARRLASLDLLRGFEAAARHLSFTRAASELFVTQSAVSRQIRALEEAVGHELFRRRNRRLELTDAGRALFGTAAHALGQIDETVAAIRGSDAARPLTVSATVSFTALWLVPRLPRFRRKHPEIDVRIAASNELNDLEREQIDLAIRFCEPKAAPAGSSRLVGEEVFPVCSPKLLRLRDRPLREPADLRHHVILHIDDAAGRWPWLNWKQWLDAMALGDLHPAGTLRFSHYDHLVRAAIDGEGVALGRNPLVRTHVARGELVAPFPKSIVSSREYFLVTARGAERSPMVRHFIEWLRSEVAEDARAEPLSPPRRKSR